MHFSSRIGITNLVSFYQPESTRPTISPKHFHCSFVGIQVENIGHGAIHISPNLLNFESNSLRSDVPFVFEKMLEQFDEEYVPKISILSTFMPLHEQLKMMALNSSREIELVEYDLSDIRGQKDFVIDHRAIVGYDENGNILDLKPKL